MYLAMCHLNKYFCNNNNNNNTTEDLRTVTYVDQVEV